MKHRENSIQEILELGRRNLIVHHALVLFHITDKEQGAFVWQQALLHMVKALVEYSDKLAKENYDLATKSIKGPQIIINLNDLSEKEKAEILGILNDEQKNLGRNNPARTWFGDGQTDSRKSLRLVSG